MAVTEVDTEDTVVDSVEVSEEDMEDMESEVDTGGTELEVDTEDMESVVDMEDTVESEVDTVVDTEADMEKEKLLSLKDMAVMVAVMVD